MEFISVQKFIRTSPSKIRPIVAVAKKMAPGQAVKNLPFIGRRAAEPLVKVIKSALANARQKEVNETDLVIKEIQINEGPVLKRGRAGSRGRFKPYQRRMSHIRVVLATKEEKPKAQEAKVEEKKEVKKVTVKKTTKKETK